MSGQLGEERVQIVDAEVDRREPVIVGNPKVAFLPIAESLPIVRAKKDATDASNTSHSAQFQRLEIPRYAGFMLDDRARARRDQRLARSP